MPSEREVRQLWNVMDDGWGQCSKLFPEFKANFHRDRELSDPNGFGDLSHVEDANLKVLFQSFGGYSFERGLYRVMTASTVASARAMIGQAFGEFTPRAEPFGYDWLGRIFAIDRARLEDGLPAVLMFEPGTGDALEIPRNLLTFHEVELVDDPDPALALTFFEQWFLTHSISPRHDQCVGYKTPLFLGGKDDLKNLELTDLDVYWTLSGQLIQKAHGLAPGTGIASVQLSEAEPSHSAPKPEASKGLLGRIGGWFGKG